MYLDNIGISELRKAFSEKSLSPVEYAKEVIRKAKEDTLNAVANIDEEMAILNAKESEHLYMKGMPRSSLEGVIVGIKDIIETKDIVTTYGCPAYRDNVPEEDAFAVQKLKAAGVNISLKTNTAQFAMGPTGETSLDGPVLNPHDPKKVTGGSSSGSAAAVASGICTAALGTDSGGSIRLPSSFCGIVGLKPTFSVVSNIGVMPVAESVDVVGPMTRTVADNAAVFSAIAGYNPMDWRSSPLPDKDYSLRIGESVRGTKIALSVDSLEGMIQDEVRESIMAAARMYERLGAEVEEVRLPDLSQMQKAHQLLMMACAHHVHIDDIANHPEDIYPEVLMRLKTGDLKSDEYIEYESMRNEMVKTMYEALCGCNVIIHPTTPITAPLIGDEIVEVKGEKMSGLKFIPRYTWMSCYSTFPSISVPCGVSTEGMPIGLSIMGRPYDEANLYRFAGAIEQALS